MSQTSVFFCDYCDHRLWRGRCNRARCPLNSKKHLRRHAEKVRANLTAYDGKTKILTVTAPGQKWLPYELVIGDDGQVGLGNLVVSEKADEWNEKTIWKSWKSLRQAAVMHTRRRVKDGRSCVLAVVPEVQKRGVLHLHIVLGCETPRDRRWAESFGRYCVRHAARHGFGSQADLGKQWGEPVAVKGYLTKVAAYVTKGGSVQHHWERGTMPGRAFYVAPRLSRRTCVTMRTLRRRACIWAGWGVGVPVARLWELDAFEKALRRPLTAVETAELVRAPALGLPAP